MPLVYTIQSFSPSGGTLFDYLQQRGNSLLDEDVSNINIFFLGTVLNESCTWHFNTLRYHNIISSYCNDYIIWYCKRKSQNCTYVLFKFEVIKSSNFAGFSLFLNLYSLEKEINNLNPKKCTEGPWTPRKIFFQSLEVIFVKLSYILVLLTHGVYKF